MGLLSLTGCAIKNYGRMEALDTQEKSALDCPQIDDQIVKAGSIVRILFSVATGEQRGNLFCIGFRHHTSLGN